MITLHGIPNCDTVKKARAWLDAQGVDYRFHDFKKLGVSAEMLERWAESAGWETLLNRRGTTFRALSDPDKADIDRDKAVRLMEANPSLIKRPVVEDESGKVTVGFSNEAFETEWKP
ncbi:ArsC family reductase [Sphingomonas sp. HDW15A]|uniref:ArsC family reductase n=1 Tax=Sphingomonas sp. HDW15A TaxID=2714942 RepID=UPI00140E78D9|nr:ArsC family reductase [Sphingomonas sp. HDW15A]QIK96621.1 ArsC family reductase [Sphingomonas sp. HDW15A]